MNKENNSWRRGVILVRLRNLKDIFDEAPPRGRGWIFLNRVEHAPAEGKGDRLLVMTFGLNWKEKCKNWGKN